MKTKLLSVSMCIFMFYSCNPEHKETIEPEKPSVENPEEPEEPEYPDEPEIPSTNTIINLNNEFMIVGSSNWSNVVSNNNGIIVVSGGNYVTTSLDFGETWSTPKQIGGYVGSWGPSIYANGKFTLIGFSGEKVASSSDGVTWSLSDIPNVQYWRNVAYGNGMYVAVGAKEGVIMTSTDGITWTKKTVGSMQWDGIAFGNGVFIIVGGTQFSTSKDGITWASQKRVPNSLSEYKTICFGEGVFVVVDSYKGYTQTTNDGVTWSNPNATLGEYNWGNCAYGNGKFIAVGRSGRISISTDGATWNTTQIKDESGKLYSEILYDVCVI